ncbi:manganese catalase family protein [Aminipila sp.]|uniref:manganese catalase family protein n=1 Tax=Aminipila sp. TaxID=2060095 RepID=UPI00289BC8BA|nr:manganese catalase family protein [Aminipila sp.]
MWTYDKKLQFPVNIKNPNPAMAKYIITQYGGPDGELGATLRYLSQRYTMPFKQCIGILNDIGTEEIGHFEMVATIVHQLTRGLTIEQIKAAGFGDYFVDHTTGLYTVSAAGVPFDATCFASKGDAITDLMEDMAAEQKARTTYDNILRLAVDPDVIEPIKFLREREVVHFQRFGEALRVVQDNLDSRNFYAINPEFDGWRQTRAASTEKPNTVTDSTK